MWCDRRVEKCERRAAKRVPVARIIFYQVHAPLKNGVVRDVVSGFRGGSHAGGYDDVD